MFYLAGHVRNIVPAIISPKRPDHCRAKTQEAGAGYFTFA